MIIVKYCGGLGNQMYQYALSCVMKQKYPEHMIKADLNHYYLLKEHNGFELDKIFSIEIPKACRKEIKKIYSGFVPIRFMKHLPLSVRQYFVYNFQTKYNKLAKVISKSKRNNQITDLKFNAYNDEVMHLLPFEHYYMDGLWQNINYFRDYEKLIKEQFKFRISLGEQEKSTYNQLQQGVSVSIHIRRGDFVGKKYDLCNLEYYQKAVDYIKHRVSNPRFFIFTDDREFVRENFSFIQYQFTEECTKQNSYMEMFYMSKCKHNIISNSTFSFWGAYLNDNIDKIVICPEFSIVDERAAHEFSVPNTWIKMKGGGKEHN